MKNSKNKIISLLGGSNSIKKNGLVLGLKKKSTVISYALGASGSLQNLYELHRNRHNIESSDLVISESNVNDFHNHNIIDLSLSEIDTSVKNLYNALSSLNSRILILILPLQTQIYKSADDINNIHIKYVKKYGLNYINIHEYVNKNYEVDKFNYNNLDHLPSIFFYLLGKLISTSVFNQHTQLKYDWDQYLIINHFNDCIFKDKINTLLNERCYEFNNKSNIVLNREDYILCGIHAWPDSPSGILINFEDRVTGKKFKDECQFQEFAEKFKLGSKCTVRLLNDKDNVEVEKGIRTSDISSLCDKIEIIAFFLKRDSIAINTKFEALETSDMTFLLNDVFDITDQLDELYIMNINRELLYSKIKKIAWKLSSLLQGFLK